MHAPGGLEINLLIVLSQWGLQWVGMGVTGTGGKGAWPLMGCGEAVFVLDLERKILKTGLPDSAVSL